MEDFKSKMIEELKKGENTVLEKKVESPKIPEVIEVVEEKNDYKEVQEVKTEFDKFKEEFFQKENIKNLIEYLEFYKEEDPTIFDKEVLALCKYEHPNMKIVSIEPNDMQEELGIQSKFWIVKPLYRKEYTNFTKTYGHREEFPDEFIDYTIRHCVLFPGVTEESVSVLPSGTVITLYHTIMELSDLNKKFKIIEV